MLPTADINCAFVATLRLTVGYFATFFERQRGTSVKGSVTPLSRYSPTDQPCFIIFLLAIKHNILRNERHWLEIN